jgi:regulator of RNase E activity RraB
MSVPFLVLLGLIGVALMLSARRRDDVRTVVGDRDAVTIEELARSGSDLSRPHRIDFFLYVPSRPAAEELATELRAQGLQVGVERETDGHDWLCLASVEMLPELGLLRSWRARLTALAEARNGVYDGWGTEVLE